jgi:eukaryotic translation initiation factor 2C
MEFLEIAPAQKYQKRLTGNQVSDMIRATVEKPEARFQKLNSAVGNILKPNDDPYLKSIGMKISPEMMRVNARILPAPQIIFAGNRTQHGMNGVWNLRGVELCSTPTLTSCAVVFFTRLRQNDAENIVEQLMSKWKRSGMAINLNPRDIPIRVYLLFLNDILGPTLTLQVVF